MLWLKLGIEEVEKQLVIKLFGLVRMCLGLFRAPLPRILRNDDDDLISESFINIFGSFTIEVFVN